MNSKEAPTVEVRISEDGSTTFYRADLDEHYHSVHGAIQESNHIFIQAGLKQLPHKELTILEVGFGTGLNALLTWLQAPQKTILYHTLERYPLSPDMVSKINYSQCLQNSEAQLFFDRMHQAPWDKLYPITPNFSLLKMKQDLLTYRPDTLFDLIYFDAFGPDKQPELWTPQVFENLSRATHPGGILTTYSVKGTVKRALKSAGFAIEKIPGPPGKREIIRATKI